MGGDGGQAFIAYLEWARPQVDDALSRAVGACPPARDAQAGDDVVRYLYGPLAGFVERGGKRVRPALALLGAEAVGAEASCALSSAVAVEQFQAAALVHDDIADGGELRRGGPCLHRSEGVGIAVNVGDAALTGMYACVLRDGSLDARTRLAVLDELAAMAERTLEGQALDLGWARDGRWDITPDDYRRMATLKTAHYSAATPLVLGALCGGGSEGQLEALRAFGLAAGLAFQLQDDLLNLVGDAADKDLMSDVTEGKRTLAAVHALAHLPPERAAELVGLLSSRTSEPAALRRAVGLMEAAGALDHVCAVARGLVERAKGELASVELEPRAREVLESMADFFVERTA